MDDLPYSSVPDMLRQNAARFQGQLALKYRKQGKFVTLSYEEYYDRALMAARGLRKCSVKPGDTVAILSENRAGWVIADMGILSVGGVTVPIYPTNTPEQIEYVLNHSEARIVFVSSKFQYPKLLKIRTAHPEGANWWFRSSAFSVSRNCRSAPSTSSPRSIDPITDSERKSSKRASTASAPTIS